MSADTIEQLLTTEDVCEFAKVSRSTVKNWIRKRLLPVVKIGRSVRIKREDLRQFIESHVAS